MSLQLNALFRQISNDMIDLDQTEADQKRGREVMRRQMGDQRKTDLRSLAARMASQGLSHSGINLENNVDLNKAYDQAGIEADAQLQNNLATIARKRLNAQTSLNEARLLDQVSALGQVIGGQVA